MKRGLVMVLVLSFLLVSFLSFSTIEADGVTSLNGTHIITECVYNGTLGSCGTQSNSSFLITSCQNITSPGSYILQNSLIGTNNAPCLNIHDTNQVYLDCANNGISFDGSIFGNGIIRIVNVSSFFLKNCVINANGVPANNIALGISVLNSSNGIISNNSVTGSLVDVRVSSNFQVMENTFVRSAYQQSGGSNNNIIDGNSFDGSTGSATLISILSSDGSGNIIRNNFVDGHGTGVTVGPHNGSDDGIVLDNESGSSVLGNTLQNFWGCGIESTGLIKNTTISYNIVRNALYCGIGGWYWNSLQGNTYSGNRVDNSGTLFTFYRLYALRPGEDFVYFTDNVFTNNVLTNVNDKRGYATDIDMSKNMYDEVDSSNFIAYNDTFANNDFGPGYGPYLLPRSAIVDGGGNKCGPVSLDQATSPLVCNGSNGTTQVNKTLTNKNLTNNTPTNEINCQGCFVSGTCYPVEYRTDKQYCSINLTLVPQAAAGESCQNNFECGSNVCVSNQCVSNSLIQMFLSWLKKLFG